MPTLLMTRKRAAVPLSRLATIRQGVLKDLDKVDSYPTLSETTARAMILVNNPEVSSAEVAGLIRRDAVVAAAVLRRANNWTYGARRVIDNLQQAVLRVGLQECGKILCAMGLQAIYERHAPKVRERCDAIQRHSLFVAHLASELNRTAGFGFSGVEFTAGLLHDIGRVVIAVRCPDEDDYNETARLEGPAQLQCERDTYGIDHCAVGEQFAVRNGLPEQLAHALRNHHTPADERFHGPLVALIAFCNRIANHTQREHNIAGYDLGACPVFPMLGRGDPFARALPGMVLRAFKSTHAMLKSFA